MEKEREKERERGAMRERESGRLASVHDRTKNKHHTLHILNNVNRMQTKCVATQTRAQLSPDVSFQ